MFKLDLQMSADFLLSFNIPIYSNHKVLRCCNRGVEME